MVHNTPRNSPPPRPPDPHPPTSPPNPQPQSLESIIVAIVIDSSIVPRRKSLGVVPVLMGMGLMVGVVEERDDIVCGELRLCHEQARPGRFGLGCFIADVSTFV